ncbi:ISLre2 family transposase [Lachnospiraceae bacterium C1.1]|nr:ISLre2 family transposase [Lachnospiraceae bacterium C1.1]MDN4742539.1 ISLre2 family transposase [Lachnospiraceae bacterium C1.1]MDN4742792.1 ISLre2 family transposase [Lachnospiraceae bacterium C1.1]MDN4744177.1 ISLre2 family transposase [Lachnospiraceae bacterium C1.1]MDN4745045.1 ISLre2 family transposase [Lachnospiraceae bacterium C1.1]
MENIIRYFMYDCIKNLFNTKLNLYKDTTDLAYFVLNVQEEVQELGRRFIQDTLQEMNQLIKDMPERKNNWYVEHKGDSKKILTSLGEVIVNKTLYTSKFETDENGKYLECYLLDKVLGLSPNQAMTEDVTAKIYKEAALTSYQKAGEEATAREGVTKAAVKNILHSTRFPKNFQIPEQKRIVEYLYIDADEDHYHLQFQSSRGDLKYNSVGRKLNGAINKIIYVFEGIEPVSPKSKRNHLINTHYFCRGSEEDNKQLWKEVFDYIENKYDTSAIKKIYVNSDGGTWIKSGYRGLADVTFVLDEFHISKYVSKLIQHTKDSEDDARSEVMAAIRDGKKSDFFEVVEKLKNCTTSEAVVQRIDSAASYISSNWTAAKYRLKKSEGVVACSAEGHVCHVLSKRMSTLPMGWCRLGGSKMARLREYYYNGGDMLELARFQRKEIPMAAGAEEVVLSARAMLNSERTDRSKSLIEYGKYAESIRSSISVQSSKRLSFQLNGKLKF